MKYGELEDYIGAILPEAELGFDNDGQLIVYTNLMEDDHTSELVEFEPLS